MKAASPSRRAAFIATAVLSTCVCRGVLGQIAIGDLVVVRTGPGVGSGSVLTSQSTPTSLDEMTTAGAFVQTIAMPIAAAGSNRAFTNSGIAFSEGHLTQSVD